MHSRWSEWAMIRSCLSGEPPDLRPFRREAFRFGAASQEAWMVPLVEVRPTKKSRS